MISDRELEVLINDVYEYYGYDFSGYSRASFKRRVDRLYDLDGFRNFSDMLSKVRTDEDYFRRMVEEVTVNVTEMFRDPQFYKVLRTEILPVLAPKPFIRIWHAGCSTGEEVFSMAILLKEANLLHKSLLYATDLNPVVLDSAKKGVFNLRMMNVVTAIDGKEALKALEQHPEVDVVLLDMMMPNMDGYETATRIRDNKKYKDLPVIAVTAKAMTGDREKCINAGASDYITKPVDVDQLLSLLRVWLYDKQ